MSEAARNAIEHAYRPVTAASAVELTLLLDQGTIGIEIVDHGRWQPPTNPGYRSGRGIALIRRVVDSVIIRFDTAGTRVLLQHRMPARTGGTGADGARHLAPDGSPPSAADHDPTD